MADGLYKTLSVVGGVLAGKGFLFVVAVSIMAVRCFIWAAVSFHYCLISSIIAVVTIYMHQSEISYIPLGLVSDYVKSKRKVKDICDGLIMLLRNQWTQIQVQVTHRNLTHIYKQ